LSNLYLKTQNNSKAYYYLKKLLNEELLLKNNKNIFDIYLNISAVLSKMYYHKEVIINIYLNNDIFLYSTYITLIFIGIIKLTIKYSSFII